MKKSAVVIGVTGSPGVGKKSVGRIVADQLGFEYVDLNRLAVDGSVILAWDEEDFMVDAEALRRVVSKFIADRSVVVVGHLLPEVLTRGEVDFVAVLRCSPWELERRYAGRGYSDRKVRDNIGTEVLDICLTDALRRFGVEKVSEFDTTGRSAEDVAKEVLEVFKSGHRRGHKVNWIADLVKRGELEKYVG